MVGSGGGEGRGQPEVSRSMFVGMGVRRFRRPFLHFVHLSILLPVAVVEPPAKSTPSANMLLIGIVDQQHPADLFTTHPAIQQHQRVRPPGQTMLSQPVPSQLGQVLPFLCCHKPPRIMVPE